jgi:hypothetical protein
MATEINDFGKVVATIVVHDKKGVTDFLKGQGVNVSATASNDAIISAIMLGSKNTKFAKSFLVWADNTYSSKANFSYNSADGFDPMDSHYADGGFDPMNAQNGVSLKSDFANFDYGSTDGVLGSASTPVATGNTSGTATKSKLGTFLGGLDFGDILKSGVNIYATSSANKQQQAIANAQIEAKKLEIEALKEAGKLSQAQANQQLALLQASGGGKSNTLVYVIAGVSLLAVIGIGYYLLKKKG